MSVLMHWLEKGSFRRVPLDDGGKGDCLGADILFLAGTGVTNSSGEWSLDVHDSLCGVKLGDVRWVSMVAAPSQRLTGHPHRRPSFVTTEWLLNPPSLTLFVQSWDCRCEPLADLEFGYHVAIARSVPQPS